MTTRLGELAQLVEGQLVGDSVNPIAETAIHDAATLRDVQAGEITLADNPRMAGELASGQAAAAVVGSALCRLVAPERCGSGRVSRITP